MISLDLLLIPVLGINGAAIASSISYIVATISIIFSYTRITGNPLRGLLIPTKSDFATYKKLFFTEKIKIL
jgi:Na+-driven multidrug efflux pump